MAEKRGVFHRHASEYRLTAYPNDLTEN